MLAIARPPLGILGQPARQGFQVARYLLQLRPGGLAEKARITRASRWPLSSATSRASATPAPASCCDTARCSAAISASSRNAPSATAGSRARARFTLSVKAASSRGSRVVAYKRTIGDGRQDIGQQDVRGQCAAKLQRGGRKTGRPLGIACQHVLEGETDKPHDTLACGSVRLGARVEQGQGNATPSSTSAG